ncbi:MAG: RNA methyltransferase tRNA(m5U54)methyltransferase [Claussenomyces sp. TS43310]|nr:MAG: RNA methyltransferase tRNA(m5U54)methyltransferase [Claussenomyces sp. TS43310]
MSSSTLPASISASPAAGQRITHNEIDYSTLKEGLAHILVPASTSSVPQTTPKGENQAQSVFYNPIQQFNRDLSVLAIKVYGKDTLDRKKAELAKRHRITEAKKSRKRKRGEDVVVPEEPPRTSNLDEDLPAPDDSLVKTGESTKETEGHAQSKDMVPPDHTNGQVSAITAVNRDVERTSTAGLSNSGSVATTQEHTLQSATTQSPTVDENDPKHSHSPSFTILDALSATGLRALRYALEIPFTTSVTANDLLPAATESIKLNVEHNKLSGKIIPVTGNALAHMYSLAVEQADSKGKPKPAKKYDVIDLDPYGTAAPFLDAAVQSVKDGGLLCVTCTDGGVWASNGYPEKAYSLYGGIPIKGMHSHEGGLRLILHAIATSAARYGLAMEPLLSLSIDFYARVFVKIRKSPADVKFLAGKTMVVYNCDTGCGAWTTQLLARNKLAENKSGVGTYYKHVFALAPNTGELCEHCKSKMHMAGPMYAGPLHSPVFVQKILDELPNISKETYMTTTRIEGMLSMALEETLEPLDAGQGLESPTANQQGKNDPAAVDHYPFFFVPSVISKVIHCVTPHENALRGALRHLGYRVTRSHTKAGSIKTDAPWSVIWDIMKEWAKQKAPIRQGAVRQGTAGWRLLGLDASDDASAESPEVAGKLKIVFDEELGKEKEQKKLVRYQLNPRENWGPMSRARG